MSSFEQILYDVEDGIATITLNRPGKLNAFTARMVHEMLGILDLVDGDDGVRAVIVTGAGRAFCAGADMSEGASTFEKTSQAYEKPPAGNEAKRSDHVDRVGTSTGSVDNNRAKRDGGGIVSLRLFQCLKPVIAAVNGPAVGVGSTMLLPMDVRLSSTEAKFGFVFTKRGIVPEAASSWFLPRVVGISQALEWSFSGKVFDAQEAMAGGLVKSLHEPNTLMADARALAHELTEHTSSVSVAMARQQLWRMLGAAHPMEAHEVESAAVPQLGAMADAVEGVTSFLEKRPPNFTLGPASDMPPVYPWFDEPEFQPYD